jgi:TrmH family RNA methyltransferase
MGDGRAREPGACVEGAGLLEAALGHGAVVEAVLVCSELLRTDRAVALVGRLDHEGVPVLQVSEKTFARLSRRDGPDGVAAVVRVVPPRLCDVEVPRYARVVVLDGLELPGNVGSLVRCSSAIGAAAVLCTGGRVRANHPLVVKASVGAVFSVPMVTTTEDEALAWLRARDFQVVAADPGATTSYRDARYGPRVAVVLGSERYGLSAFWRNAAHERLAIPMQGHVDSLNAGHAGALFLFEVAHRHWDAEGDEDGRDAVTG